MVQATPAQLADVFDLDLWRSAKPGLDEQFDAARFGVWLEVLSEAGADIAAGKLAEMPLPQIVAGLAHHVDVYDVAAVSTYETTDGEQWDYSRPIRDRVGCEIAGYHVAARRDDAWDAIVDVLTSLDMHHPDRFVALMRAVRSRSHSRREADGSHALLENREQMMFDEADAREQRRQARGFASPADARTFLRMSRSVTPESIRPNPIAQDYHRAMSVQVDAQEDVTEAAEAEREAVELLADAGVVAMAPPRALLGAGDTVESSRIERDVRLVFERDAAAYGDRNFELAYLANVLITGCSIQGRPFTPKEATDAAVAICNLGLERIAPPSEYLLAHDLIGVFQVGWAVLHHDICVFAARSLIDILAQARVTDDDLQKGLTLLRMRLLRELQAGTPWRAADALDVMTSIDMPAWAALVGLIAECPVIHAGLNASIDRRVRSVDPHAFEFIAEPAQLDAVRQFMHALPAILGP